MAICDLFTIFFTKIELQNIELRTFPADFWEWFFWDRGCFHSVNCYLSFDYINAHRFYRDSSIQKVGIVFKLVTDWMLYFYTCLLLISIRAFGNPFCRNFYAQKFSVSQLYILVQFDGLNVSNHGLYVYFLPLTLKWVFQMSRYLEWKNFNTAFNSAAYEGKSSWRKLTTSS